MQSSSRNFDIVPSSQYHFIHVPLFRTRSLWNIVIKASEEQTLVDLTASPQKCVVGPLPPPTPLNYFLFLAYLFSHIQRHWDDRSPHWVPCQLVHVAAKTLVVSVNGAEHASRSRLAVLVLFVEVTLPIDGYISGEGDLPTVGSGTPLPLIGLNFVLQEVDSSVSIILFLLQGHVLDGQCSNSIAG